MKYKMIAMDMDGTLLTDDKRVTENTKTTLKKAADLGIKLVVCTGRIFTSAKVYAKIIGTEAPIIASNGAYIREKDRNEVIYERILDKESVSKIVKMAKRYEFYPHIFNFNTIYTEKLAFSSKNYSKWNESLEEEDKIKIEIVKDINDIVGNVSNILKVIIMTDENHISELQELRNKIEKEMDVSVVSSLYNNMEVMAKDVSKGNGVKQLADYYGFTPEEIICIGDNENDLSMIEYAGLGVAMGNASEQLKAAANYITDTNEEEGVAKVIEKFIFENNY